MRSAFERSRLHGVDERMAERPDRGHVRPAEASVGLRQHGICGDGRRLSRRAPSRCASASAPSHSPSRRPTHRGSGRRVHDRGPVRLQPSRDGAQVRPRGPARRSAGSRSRSEATRAPMPESLPAHPHTVPSHQRSAKSARKAAGWVWSSASWDAMSCTRRARSSGPPGVGSAQTSSRSKPSVNLVGPPGAGRVRGVREPAEPRVVREPAGACREGVRRDLGRTLLPTVAYGFQTLAYGPYACV